MWIVDGVEQVFCVVKSDLKLARLAFLGLNVNSEPDDQDNRKEQIPHGR